MRNVDTMRAIRDVATLQAWLYADEGHRITVVNSAGAELELSMNEEAETLVRYRVAGRKTRPRPYDSMLSVPIWLGIIDQLREQAPETTDAGFTSRWDEIKHQLAVIAALNESK